jgi:uncharacterized protein (DUF427 family)
VRTAGQVRDGRRDLAWAYDFPTRQLLPITGLVAFYNEKIDIGRGGRAAATSANPFLQVINALAA